MTEPDLADRLATAFPLVDDHPDVAGVLRDAELLAALGPALAAPFAGRVDKVLSPEARGPILGGLVAVALGAGLILHRKDERNHPGADVRTESAPTWRGHTETFLARSFDIDPTDRVLVVDDWITTGSSIRAARDFIRLSGAEFVGAAVMVNKATDAVIADLRVHWLVEFETLLASRR